MKEFIVSSEKDQKKVLRVISGKFPALDIISLQKALRKKDIRVNGKKISKDQPVFSGDTVEIWLPDSAFFAEKPLKQSESDDPDYKIVYESDDILLVNKRQGLSVHPGKGTIGETLIEIIRREQKNPSINLCHRIDMNTGGILLLAKNKKSLEDAASLFRGNAITKRYRCLVKGVPTQGEDCVCCDNTIMKEISAYLEKPKKGGVFIHDTDGEDFLPITTRYRVLQEYPEVGPDKESICELEVELVTGRTHQIRAQFAHLGHPLLGDGNYGRNQFNRFFTGNNHKHIRYQQLFSSTLLFGRIPKENCHFGLSGRAFSILPRYEISFGTDVTDDK